MTDKAVLEKVAKLVETLSELNARERDVIDELEKVLSGGPGIGAQLKRLEAFYVAAWMKRYGSPYVFTYVKDRPQWKRLIKNLRGDVDEIERRVTAYLQNPDQFFVKARHGFGLFVATFNQHAHLAIGVAETPIGCRHMPLCSSDAEHTKLRQAELRSVAE